MPNEQIIDTAPTDGSWVLVYDCKWFIAAYGDYGWCPAYGDERSVELNPTHWMLLPANPRV